MGTLEDLKNKLQLLIKKIDELDSLIPKEGLDETEETEAREKYFKKAGKRARELNNLEREIFQFEKELEKESPTSLNRNDIEILQASCILLVHELDADILYEEGVHIQNSDINGGDAYFRKAYRLFEKAADNLYLLWKNKNELNKYDLRLTSENQDEAIIDQLAYKILELHESCINSLTSVTNIKQEDANELKKLQSKLNKFKDNEQLKDQIDIDHYLDWIEEKLSDYESGIRSEEDAMEVEEEEVMDIGPEEEKVLDIGPNVNYQLRSTINQTLLPPRSQQPSSATEMEIVSNLLFNIANQCQAISNLNTTAIEIIQSFYEKALALKNEEAIKKALSNFQLANKEKLTNDHDINKSSSRIKNYSHSFEVTYKNDLNKFYQNAISKVQNFKGSHHAPLGVQFEKIFQDCEKETDKKRKNIFQ